MGLEFRAVGFQSSQFTKFAIQFSQYDFRRRVKAGQPETKLDGLGPGQIPADDRCGGLGGPGRLQDGLDPLTIPGMDGRHIDRLDLNLIFRVLFDLQLGGVRRSHDGLAAGLMRLSGGSTLGIIRATP